MSVDHAPETGTTASGTAAKVTGASIENLSQREASERHVPVMLDLSLIHISEPTRPY